MKNNKLTVSSCHYYRQVSWLSSFTDRQIRGLYCIYVNAALALNIVFQVITFIYNNDELLHCWLLCTQLHKERGHYQGY